MERIMKAVQEVTIPLKNFAQLIAGCALDERQRRWFYGFLASEIGYGGAAAVARSLAGILHEWTNLRQMVTLYDFVFKPLILEKSLYKQT